MIFIIILTLAITYFIKYEIELLLYTNYPFGDTN
jgi:hypothetical protein